ncbi:DUF2812 domain-containing protein [Tissierella praeacuta]|uniref:DUF2812 domain-containing protein n=1 Tax=Tissierella praeacuta TaxID=43131 RepID=UPI00334164A1
MSTKRELFIFSASDINAMEEHFEQMARKGWMLDKVGEYLVRYKRIEPRELKFCIDLFPKLSVFDYPNNSDVLKYRNPYIDSGWNFLVASNKFQVFYSQKEDDLPSIQTDEREKQSIINKSLLSEMVIFTICLLIFIWNLYRLSPVNYNRFKSNTGIVTAIIGPVFIIPTVVYIFSYGFWMIRAKIAIKNGEKLPKTSYKSLRFRTLLLLYPALILQILLIIASIADLINGDFFGVFLVLPIAVGYTAGILFKKNKNKRKRSKDKNIVLFIIIIVLIVIVVNIIITKLYGIIDSRGSQELQEGYKGLTLNDFNHMNSDYSNFYWERSVLLPKVSIYYEKSSGENRDYVRTEYIKAINNEMAKYVFDGMVKEGVVKYNRTVTPASMNYDYFNEAFFIDYADNDRSVILLKDNEIFYIESKFDLSDEDNINIIVNKLDNY